MKFYRPTWVEISKRAFAANVRRVRAHVGRGVEVLAVLKADGYGHGADALAPVALRAGADSIGVSSLEEGLAIRARGIRAPILVLGSFYPFESFSLALRHRLVPTVASFDSARRFARIAARRPGRTAFHLKVDTGMGRIGVSPPEAKRILRWAAGQPKLRVAGIYSHLSSADSSRAFTDRQIRLFRSVRDAARALGFRGVAAHLANSAGTLRFRASHFDMVRPGLILYGISPFGAGTDAPYSPVLSWRTRIIFLKNVPKGTPISYGRTYRTHRRSRIATLPVGYADGLPRLASNRGSVLVRGRRCPIVGRITMDQTMIDVTGLSADIDEPVTLIGRDGASAVTAHDWARWASTNPYEIVCGISKRVPRVVAR